MATYQDVLMAILPLLKFPEERLYTRAVAVTEVNDSIRQIINDMFETMYAESGIGLAATQVNIHQRIVVINLSEEQQPQIFINPQIMTQEGSACISEGCLSVPGFRAEISRAASVTIRVFMPKVIHLLYRRKDYWPSVCNMRSIT
jgi:peptide deformylase